MTPLNERSRVLAATDRRQPPRPRLRTIATLVALTLFAAIDTPTSAATGPARTASFDSAAVPEGLSASEWSDIRQAIQSDYRAVRATESGHEARNPGQRWHTSFDGTRFIITPHAGDWTWGLKLMSYGRGDDQLPVTVPARIDSQGQRLTYQWNDSVSEWYLNDQRGLEHGYTVHQRPGTGDGLLCFTLAVQGDLRPKIDGDRRGIAFVNSGNATVVTYRGLTAFDADGASVPTWFDMNGDAIQLHVDDSQARYPLTIDPVAQDAYLKASNPGQNDAFGYAVAASQDTIVISASREESAATGVNGNQLSNGAPSAGAVYVFVRNGGSWTQQAYLKASNTGSYDRFGISVAISGDTVVVGANEEASNATGVNGNQSDNSIDFAGAAYVFVRNGTTWTQQAYLKASNTGPDYFASSVSVSGNTIVVGAPQEASNATGVNGNQADNSAWDSGAAYVFVRNGTTWSQQAYLKASNANDYDRFGYSVAISNDTVVVGAISEKSNATGVNGNQLDNSFAEAGAAYVFVRNGTTWSQQAYLKASNTGIFDSFGRSVAISDDTVLVGASGESSNATGVNGNQADDSSPYSGAAYAFVRNGSTWSQHAYLKATHTGQYFFGFAVAISGDAVVVGAKYENSAATGIDGNQNDVSAPYSGAAYVFTRSVFTWTPVSYLKASNSNSLDSFGSAVAISGDTIVVGASAESSNASGVNGDQSNNSMPSAGAAYVFSGFSSTDSDGDGVPDEFDVCPNTPLGLAVDCDGRPLRDCNNDCLVDGDDLQCIINEMMNQ